MTDLTPVGPQDQPEPERLADMSSEDRLRARCAAAERLSRSKEGEILAQILESIREDAVEKICQQGCQDVDYERGRVAAVSEIVTALDLPAVILRNREARERRKQARGGALRRLKRDMRMPGAHTQGVV